MGLFSPCPIFDRQAFIDSAASQPAQLPQPLKYCLSAAAVAFVLWVPSHRKARAHKLFLSLKRQTNGLWQAGHEGGFTLQQGDLLLNVIPAGAGCFQKLCFMYELII